MSTNEYVLGEITVRGAQIQYIELMRTRNEKTTGRGWEEKGTFLPESALSCILPANLNYWRASGNSHDKLK